MVNITQVGSKNDDLQTLALDIYHVCACSGISLEVEWIPRAQNDRADYLSRIVDYDDWGITTEIFRYLDKNFGPHTIDRFANDENAKVARSNSRFWNPGSKAVDAFTQDWGNDENNLLVPPVYLVLKVVKH